MHVMQTCNPLAEKYVHQKCKEINGLTYVIRTSLTHMCILSLFDLTIFYHIERLLDSVFFAAFYLSTQLVLLFFSKPKLSCFINGFLKNICHKVFIAINFAQHDNFFEINSSFQQLSMVLDVLLDIINHVEVCNSWS